MSRHGTNHSYGHSIVKIFNDCYDLSWTVDRHYVASRLRFPTSYRRNTDERGAQRFAKKWGLELPKEPR